MNEIDFEQKITELKERLGQITQKKDIVKLTKKVAELEKSTQSPDFWNDQETAQKTMQKLGEYKNEIELIKNLENEINETMEFAKMSESDSEMQKFVNDNILKLDKTLSKLELSTFMSGKFDEGNAIVKIYAGQGGTEANDWTEMLFRMYTRFFNTKGWKITVIEKIDGNEAGIQSVTMIVEGRYVYGTIKHEKGTHRLVRNSPFNSAGLRQTSFANVEVLPLIEEDIDIEIKEEDIEFSAVRSSGAGGQNVNKVATKVRLVHKPTNIVVECSIHKTQSQNRKEAERILKAKLYELEEQKRKETLSKLQGEHKKAQWGNQIRNYILQPYKLVKDLRTGVETSQVEMVLDGELDEFVEAEIKML
ncbi:MAG: peptide chain release factor 2 [Candidatus Dojkabacteria bacterium]|nr:MAG: peptide chain release factor 2 [Candidatus Dojkabacteria bacterium]